MVLVGGKRRKGKSALKPLHPVGWIFRAVCKRQECADYRNAGNVAARASAIAENPGLAWRQGLSCRDHISSRNFGRKSRKALRYARPYRLRIVPNPHSTPRQSSRYRSWVANIAALDTRTRREHLSALVKSPRDKSALPSVCACAEARHLVSSRVHCLLIRAASKPAHWSRPKRSGQRGEP
jgi:hypothetical protein